MLIPITLAVLLSFVLAPLVALLRRIGLPRVPSVLLAVLLALGVVMVLGRRDRHAGGAAGRRGAALRQHDRAARSRSVRGFTLGQLSALMQRLGRMEPPPKPRLHRRRPAGRRGAARAAAPIPVEVHQPDPTPLEMVERLLGPVLSPLATLGIVFVVAVFILMQREDLRDRLIRLFGSSDLHRTTAALDDAAYAAQPLFPDAALR